MSTNTTVENRWFKGLPIALIILSVGLILSYLVTTPLPAIQWSVPAPESVSTQRGQGAYAARYAAMAQAFAAQEAASTNIQSSREAEAARYNAMAVAYAAKEAAGIQRGWVAYTARYAAMGKPFTTESDGVQRGLEAFSARYAAMAEAYGAKEAAAIQRGWDAYVARYAAMAKMAEHLK